MAKGEKHSLSWINSGTVHLMDGQGRVIHGQLAWKWHINESGLKLIAAITERRKSCRIGLKRFGNG